MGAWFVDEEGRDVFRGGVLEAAMNDRVASAEESLPDSLSGVGSAVDDADQVLRDAIATNPFALVSNSGTDAAREIEENPRKMKAIIAVVAVAVALYLLRPLLTIIAGISR